MLSNAAFLKRSLVLVGFALAVFPLFYRLGEAPLRIWDESLFAMRAYYMAEEGGYLPNFDYFPGITFYRNLKPPLGTWFQAAAFSMLGYSEWALRLPVAIFAALLVVLLFTWGGRASGGMPYAGVAAGLILVASPGFLRDHVARTGDHDAILLLWMTAGAFFSFFAAQAESRGSRRLWVALLCLSLFLGFLTKSFFAFAFVPAFVLFWLWQGRLREIVSDPAHWGIGGLLILAVGLYYLRMESAFPGFWNFESNTVLGRYVKVQDGHELPWYYYIKAFFDHRFAPWYFLLPVHVYLLIRSQSAAFRAFGMLLWLCLLSHLLIITLSTTKLGWYDAPMYPIAALMAGSVIGELWVLWRKPAYRLVLVSVPTIVLGATYFRGLQEIAQTGPASQDEYYQPFMRWLQEEHPDLKHYTVYCYEYNGQVGYSAKLLNDHAGYKISAAVYYPERGFGVGTHIMVCSAEKEERLRLENEMEIVAEQAPCRLLRIKAPL